MDSQSNGNALNGSSGNGSALIFLGTGCSSAIPNIMCLIQPSDPPCRVCSQALSLPPEQNPNYRCNTSMLIDYCPGGDGKHNYILIDVGKTFREQVLRWFTFHKIPRVDSIILTHEHADAVLGLDDVRTVQPFSPTNDIDPTPIFLTQSAMESIAVKFPYLVMHGEDYVCLGFLFGEKYKVAYISDVSRFPGKTEFAISKSGAGQLDLLILDALYKTCSGIACPYDNAFLLLVGSFHKFSSLIFLFLCREDLTTLTFVSLRFSLEAVKRLCPKRALLIGMTHELDHHKDGEYLEEWSKREGIPVQFAHDGLRVPVEL
ncbi:unnamed protein product [Linum tenue]|uniref:Metallo-beta-lactamase domain-containing protein n=1 Tax=Linum tenue TaxID=586396 RepID=A0AAV0QH33_9ROSI|nr:unnamed protein product [Linum tenue]